MANFNYYYFIFLKNYEFFEKLVKNQQKITVKSMKKKLWVKVGFGKQYIFLLINHWEKMWKKR